MCASILAQKKQKNQTAKMKATIRKVIKNNNGRTN